MQIKIVLKRAIASTVYNLINAAIQWKKRKKISEKESPVHRFFLVCAVKEIFRDS